MLYLLAFILPPVAVLIAGKPVQAVLNVFLCLLFLIPGWIHAFAVVNNYYADKRTKRLERAIRESAPAPAPAAVVTPTTPPTQTSGTRLDE